MTNCNHFFIRIIIFLPFLFFGVQSLPGQTLLWKYELGDNASIANSIRCINNKLEIAGNSSSDIDFDPGSSTYKINATGRFIATYDTNAIPVKVIPANQTNRFGDNYSYDVDKSGNIADGKCDAPATSSGSTTGSGGTTTG